MQYATFFAMWLLSALILGAVHGPAIGTFLGLGVATGFVLAFHAPAAATRWRERLQRERQPSHNSPAPNT
jgi:uncharacterized membrane protein